MKDAGIALLFLVVFAVIYNFFASAVSGSSTEVRALIVILLAIIGGLFNAYVHKGELSASDKFEVESGKITKEDALSKPDRENHFFIGALITGVCAIFFVFLHK